MADYKFKSGLSSHPKGEGQAAADSHNIPVEAIKKARTLGFDLGNRLSLKHYPNVFSDRRLRSHLKRV